MKNFESPNNNQSEISESEKARYESALWKQAEKLSNIRIQLEKRKDELYKEIHAKKGSDLMDLEKEYWQVERDLNNIKEQENIVQKFLEALADNSIKKEEIEKFIADKKESEDEKNNLSKKKQRILEEREKLGIDSRQDPYTSKEFSNEKMRLTTGRRAKNIKNTDTSSALNEFLYKTTDTHGGKGAIKKGDSYISKSGKKIRKK